MAGFHLPSNNRHPEARRMGFKLSRIAIFSGAILLACAGFYYFSDNSQFALMRADRAELQRISEINQARNELQKNLSEYFKRTEFPPVVSQSEFQGTVDDWHLEYTIDPLLQKEANKLLRQYKPDYGAIVMLNALTGEVLALSSFDRANPNAENLNFRATFPAASIFKIVTATAAVDKQHISPETIVLFNGSNHTLYRSNVMQTKVNRWTRGMTLREAFARSVNTFFGRLTFEHLEPSDLNDYAIRFGFNQSIPSDLPVDPGFTEVPQEKNFQLAEIASGFNRVTRMSPIQGAMIAASIAADGVMKVPYVVKEVKSPEGETVFTASPVVKGVTMTAQGAEKLKELMEATISMGTSRTAFKPLRRDRRFTDLELGGKTGSLTGDNPRGKTDWFVGYAVGGENEKIAIAALTVNKEFWTVESSHLAQTLFKISFRSETKSFLMPLISIVAATRLKTHISLRFF
jgi:peptidoglycan glycosyltransferase